MCYWINTEEVLGQKKKSARCNYCNNIRSGKICEWMLGSGGQLDEQQNCACSSSVSHRLGNAASEKKLITQWRNQTTPPVGADRCSAPTHDTWGAITCSVSGQECEPECNHEEMVFQSPNEEQSIKTNGLEEECNFLNCQHCKKQRKSVEVLHVKGGKEERPLNALPLVWV